MRAGTARSLIDRRPALAGAALLALAWAVTLLVPPWSDESVGDLGTRSIYADLMLGGELPYGDFGFEYPPLAAPAIALPGLVGVAEGDYRLGSAAFTFLLAVAVLVLLLALAPRTGGRLAPVVLAVSAAPLLLGAVARLHFDPVAVALLLGALLALCARRPGPGMALLGLGALTKGFPLVAAPVALAWVWAGGDRRELRDGALGLLLPLLIVGAGWVAYSPDGAHDTLSYQADRPIQIESSPASALLIADALGAADPATVESHGTVGLEHPLDVPLTLLVGAALAATVVTAAALATLARRRGGGGQAADPGAARALVLGAACAVTAFAAFGRVLSPQYLLWLVPLFALAAAWRMRALAVACAAALALTQAEFPSRYFDLVAREPLAVAITAARNAALLAVVALALLELRRLAAGRGGVPAGEAGASLTVAARAPAPPSAPARQAPLR